MRRCFFIRPRWCVFFPVFINMTMIGQLGGLRHLRVYESTLRRHLLRCRCHSILLSPGSCQRPRGPRNQRDNEYSVTTLNSFAEPRRGKRTLVEYEPTRLRLFRILRSANFNLEYLADGEGGRKERKIERERKREREKGGGDDSCVKARRNVKSWLLSLACQLCVQTEVYLVIATWARWKTVAFTLSRPLGVASQPDGHRVSFFACALFFSKIQRHSDG